MARLMFSVIVIMQIITLIDSTYHVYAGKQTPDVEENIQVQNICQGKEKYAEINLYVHDRLGGSTITVYEVARATITANSASSFGQVRVLDNLFTAGTNITSQRLGQIQGLITSSDLEVSAFTMNLNFYFTAGKYNGSTISILGRNQIMNAQRELAVVGGTGVFRMARGYAITNTTSYDVENQYGVLGYTLYVCYTYIKPSNVLKLHTDM